MAATVLIVDDEAPIRGLLQRILQRQGYQVFQAANGNEALAVLQAQPSLRLVLTDLRMPQCGGIDFIAKATARFQRLFEFIVLTGNSDKRDAIQAMRLGARDFLDKPVGPQALCDAVTQAAQRLKKKDQELAQLRRPAMLRLQPQPARKETDRQLINRLATIAQFRDVETAEHCIRVGRAAAHLAGLAGHSVRFQQQLKLAAILHDIGKIGIPDHILFKAGPLSADEFRVMETHTEIGHAMLTGSQSPVIQLAADIARYHHEHWDGSGYTQSLNGAEIPLAARVVSIADVYDALRSKRRYKEGLCHAQAMAIITEGDGRSDPAHFDPELLKLFGDHHRDFERLYHQLPDKDV